MQISMRNFVVAFLFLALALSGNFLTVQAQSAWEFTSVSVFNNMESSVATVTSERYDSSGGSVDIQLSGNIFSTCPGGNEKLRFTWSFAGDITKLTPGNGVSASLAGGQASKSQNCGTQLASRSFIYVYPGSFANQDADSIDKERFTPGNNFRAYAAESQQSGTGGVKVNTHAFNSKKPNAYFEVCIQTPTRSGGGFLCYAYNYRGSGRFTSGGGTGGGNTDSLSVEYDTDRMGGDYKDFDLPRADFELCRAACARDANCKAYTYVKPGVQGSNARCWLKSGAPGAGSSNCCISGIKLQGRSALENKFLLEFLIQEPVLSLQNGE